MKTEHINAAQLCIIGVLLAHKNYIDYGVRHWGRKPHYAMSLNELERHTHMGRSKCRYWCEKMVDEGLLIKETANQGHGYYWWYEYRLSNTDVLRWIEIR